MTKYILAGGKDRVREGYGSKLIAELHKDHEVFRILSCFFVVPEEHWTMMAGHWKKWFEEYMGDLEAYDFARPETFAEQIKNFDIIYLHGGSNKALFKAMERFDNLGRLFAGKTVVASSAGANLLSKNFWGSSRRVARKGRAVLDVNIMTHYGAPNHEGYPRTIEDWDREERTFRDFVGNDKEEIWHIPEGEFVTFEVDD